MTTNLKNGDGQSREMESGKYAMSISASLVVAFLNPKA